MASLRSLSSAACASASFTIFWMSASLRPDDAVMVIDCSLLVARSLAPTLRMPLASMSKVTSISGRPGGAGGIPCRWNLPRVRLSRAIGRSPCRTWTSTEVWLSDAVEKISLFRVGMVVFVRVDALVRLALEELLDRLLHHRDAGRTAHQHHLVDVLDRRVGVAERLLAPVSYTHLTLPTSDLV